MHIEALEISLTTLGSWVEQGRVGGEGVWGKATAGWRLNRAGWRPGGVRLGSRPSPQTVSASSM